MFTCSRKVWKGGEQSDYKTSKKCTDKKKTDLFFVFCKYFQIPRNQVHNDAEEFLENKNNINKKRFLGKATGHNDHYMINIDSQRPKIGSNWLLISHYL